MSAAAASDRLCRVTPMTMPPKMLTARMMSPAMASPRTNSMRRPSSRRGALFLELAPARLRHLLVDEAGGRSASIAICFPGMASRVKRAPTSAMRVAPLVMTRKLIVTRMRKTMMPMTKSPPITSWAKPPMI